MLVSRILKMKADDGVVTVPPGTLLGEVVRIMARRKIGAVIVSYDGQRVEGMVSEKDVICAMGEQGMVCLIDPVEDVMLRDVPACSRRDRIETVLDVLTARHLRHMPVVERGVMVGLISSGDLIAARLGELSAEVYSGRPEPQVLHAR